MINWEEKLIDYINGELLPTERQELLEAMESNPQLKEMLVEYREIYTLMDDQDHQPNSQLDQRIDDLIQGHGRSASVIKMSVRQVMAIAASICLIACIWYGLRPRAVNQQAHNPTRQLNTVKDIVTAYDNPSVSGRIHAVTVSAKMTEIDAQIKNVLIKSLTEDKSANVRLAAVESLAEKINDEWVRVHMIRALSVETDPFVQIALIDALSKTKSDDAQRVIKELVEDEEMPKFIRDEAQVGLLEFHNL